MLQRRIGQDHVISTVALLGSDPQMVTTTHFFLTPDARRRITHANTIPRRQFPEEANPQQTKGACIWGARGRPGARPFVVDARWQCASRGFSRERAPLSLLFRASGGGFHVARETSKKKENFPINNATEGQPLSVSIS